jgi:uncharacterized membrane protein
MTEREQVQLVQLEAKIRTAQQITLEAKQMVITPEVAGITTATLAQALEAAVGHLHIAMRELRAMQP